MRRWVSCLVLFFVSAAATGVKGQTAPPQLPNSWNGQPAPPPPPPPGGGWGAPAPYGAYGYPGGYGQQTGYGPSPQAFMMYESGKKQAFLALALEVFVPGAGSIYADHASGALITWGLTIAGIVLIVTGFRDAWDTDPYDDSASEAQATAILLGVGLMLGGRIYGLVDSYSSAKDYNQALARRLGLDPMYVSLAPIRMGEVTTWGPTIGLRF